MRSLKILLNVLLILLGIFLMGGLLLPPKWIVSRSVTIHATPKEIYPFVSNFKEWEKWAPWNSHKDATLQYTYQGPRESAGAKQSWKSEKMGSGWMQFTSMNPQTGVAYDIYIDMGRSQSAFQGDLRFAREGDDTRVTWTDQGDSGKNLIKRWMSLVFKSMLGKDFETGLANLKMLVEKR
jgi:hypothetical protein